MRRPVPLENLERSERMGVTSFIISSMLTALLTLLATLSFIFRSRAVLELENLALRHQIGVLRRSARKRFTLTRRTACCGSVAVPHRERLAFGPGHRQARHGRSLASFLLSPV